MNNNNNDEISVKFLLAEYQDLYQNVMHIENKLFNHLSFYITIFLGILTATVAVIQITRDQSQPINITDTLAILSIPFSFMVIIGSFEIRMITELRIRKMKFIEGITRIREYFVNMDSNLTEYLTLPSKIEKAPPYLRIGSQDWYKIVFIIGFNSISLFIFIIGLPFLFFLFFHPILNLFANLMIFKLLSYYFVIFWVIFTFIVCAIYFWFFSYRKVMAYCYTYDQKREEIMGKSSEYDMLERKLPRSRLFWTLGDWFTSFEERQIK